MGTQGAARPGRRDLPALGLQASDASAVGLETGETAHLERTGTSASATSADFLRQLRATHAAPLLVSGDNGPAHGGEAMRDDLATPGHALRAIRLPAYSPDGNPDEAIWAWAPRPRCKSSWPTSSPAWRPAPPRSNPAAAARGKRWLRP